MGRSVTLGGERLGSGKKEKVYLHGYERSSHNLDYVWRSTMSAGTLVPFMKEIGLPGDTFDIDLEADIMTHPTIGPLFGSYKVQLDIFQVPIRIYNANLHMNALNIGLNMANIKLPQVRLGANAIYNSTIETNFDITNSQVNPSSIFNYLGIKGIGCVYGQSEENIVGYREFESVSWLAYWDIYKNYYANKQEEIGAVIHHDLGELDIIVEEAWLLLASNITEASPIDFNNRMEEMDELAENELINHVFNGYTSIKWRIDPSEVNAFTLDRVWLYIGQVGGTIEWKQASEIFSKIERVNGYYIFSKPINQSTGELLSDTEWHQLTLYPGYYIQQTAVPLNNLEPKVSTFELSNIDEIKKEILQYFDNDPFIIGESGGSYPPYSLAMHGTIQTDGKGIWSYQANQEGLALKTYQSDIFNNWLNTEWLDGENGINEITAISTDNGQITIDEINLSKKIYEMLNRIAVSGGTYDDWIDAVYTHERQRSSENPMYMGGLIKELVFQEVISNAQTSEQPLGSLAGRGKLSSKHKGGKVTVKIDEPSIIMGIISLTPRIDYSQGNHWTVNLKTMDDFHKPQLDQIGFQELITDQIAWWETKVDENNRETSFRSAGKQPAWLNYMTNYNRVHGNFAIESEQMFMTLNRRYEVDILEPTDQEHIPLALGIADLTTYIDPAKFNHIFADTRRDAQNFWVQVGVGMTARRKMSAKVMPNL